jgi:hypothetical protein
VKTEYADAVTGTVPKMDDASALLIVKDVTALLKTMRDTKPSVTLPGKEKVNVALVLPWLMKLSALVFDSSMGLIKPVIVLYDCAALGSEGSYFSEVPL